MFGDDAEREQYFEATVAQAQRDFTANSSDATALVRWGGALLELAHYRQGEDATQCIQDAISRLNQALAIDPDRLEAQWCMGNAYTSLGFLESTKAGATEQFAKAKQVFKTLVEKDPSNEPYRKALEMSDRAPEYYDEIQAQISQAQAAAGGSRGGGKRGSSTGGGGGRDPLGISDFWWDAAGWVLLAGFLGGVAILARSGAAAGAAGPPKA